MAQTDLILRQDHKNQTIVIVASFKETWSLICKICKSQAKKSFFFFFAIYKFLSHRAFLSCSMLNTYFQVISQNIPCRRCF